MNSRILVVMPPERRDRLVRFLSGTDAYLVEAEGVEDAHRILSSAIPFDLTFVDAELRDGSWRDVLQFLIATRQHCELVVCARCGDERLWAEVIQCGAFDLVPEPMGRQEVLRIMNSALDSHYLDRFGRAAEARA